MRFALDGLLYKDHPPTFRFLICGMLTKKVYNPKTGRLVRWDSLFVRKSPDKWFYEKFSTTCSNTSELGEPERTVLENIKKLKNPESWQVLWPEFLPVARVVQHEEITNLSLCFFFPNAKRKIELFTQLYSRFPDEFKQIKYNIDDWITEYFESTQDLSTTVTKIMNKYLLHGFQTKISIYKKRKASSFELFGFSFYVYESSQILSDNFIHKHFLISKKQQEECPACFEATKYRFLACEHPICLSCFISLPNEKSCTLCRNIYYKPPTGYKYLFKNITKTSEYIPGMVYVPSMKKFAYPTFEEDSGGVSLSEGMVVLSELAFNFVKFTYLDISPDWLNDPMLIECLRKGFVQDSDGFCCSLSNSK